MVTIVRRIAECLGSSGGHNRELFWIASKEGSVRTRS